VHGEPAPMAALAGLIDAQLGWSVHVPQHGETIDV
jgi:hypothetical protein